MSQSRRSPTARAASRFATLALSALLAGCAHDGGADTPTPMAPAQQAFRTAPRIVNGTLTSLYPTTGVLLVPNDPGTAGMECSGTLIGCQTFLTAAHCVCQTNGALCQNVDAPDPTNFVVFLQHAGFFAVSSIAVHPDYGLADDGTGDLAVLRLSTPVTGIAPTQIDTVTAPLSGTPGTIAGFGRTGGGPSNADYGLKRVGEVTTATCNPGVSDATSVCWTFNAPFGPPGSNSDTCNGDSGGPLFIDFGAGDALAGVTSGGDSDTCLPLDHSFDASVFPYRSWIQAEAGSDLDKTSCGSLPSVGDPRTEVFAASGQLNFEAPQGNYSFPVSPGTTVLRVAMNAIDDGFSDFDLYVKAGGPPTVTDYDCAQTGSGQYGFCEFTAPTPGTWNVLVDQVFGAGLYQVTATTFNSVCGDAGSDGQTCDDNNPCTQNDTCSNGTCSGTTVGDGTPCGRSNVCTQPATCQAGVCTSNDTPRSGCRDPVISGVGLFQIQASTPGTPSRRDKLMWNWLNGSATTKSDFGDPLSSTDYDLCVYDETSGTPALVLSKQIPAGTSCGARPCWKELSGGFRYTDRYASDGGISSIQLTAGADGKAKIVVKGKGKNLQPPPLPLNQQSPVTVQLSNGTVCWEARYSSTLRNDATQFKAKPD